MSNPAEVIARAEFKARLVAEGLEHLETLLGQLAIRTNTNLANLSETEWNNTLDLLPEERPGELVDFSDATRYTPSDLAHLRHLREEVRREAMTSAEPEATPEPEAQPGGGVSQLADSPRECERTALAGPVNRVGRRARNWLGNSVGIGVASP